jgi:molybdenum cofactor biosynthesis enzyme MoaA
MDGRYMKKMAAAGCEALTFGIESASDNVLRLMSKKYSGTDVANVVRATHDAGIKVVINLIVGFPGETEDDFQQTLEFIEQNKDRIYKVAALNSLRLDPGSPARSEVDDKEYEDLGQISWSTRDGNSVAERNRRLFETWSLLEKHKIPLIKPLPLNCKEPIDERLDTLTPAMLRKMHQSGCRSLTIELGSGSDQVLRRLNRGHQLKHAISALQAMSDLGIEAVVNLTVGLAGETEAEFSKTRSFLSKNREQISRIGRLTVERGNPAHGTVLLTRAEKLLARIEELGIPVDQAPAWKMDELAGGKLGKGLFWRFEKGSIRIERDGKPILGKRGWFFEWIANGKTTFSREIDWRAAKGRILGAVGNGLTWDLGIVESARRLEITCGVFSVKPMLLERVTFNLNGPNSYSHWQAGSRVAPFPPIDEKTPSWAVIGPMDKHDRIPLSADYAWPLPVEMRLKGPQEIPQLQVTTEQIGFLPVVQTNCRPGISVGLYTTDVSIPAGQRLVLFKAVLRLT